MKIIRALIDLAKTVEDLAIACKTAHETFVYFKKVYEGDKEEDEEPCECDDCNYEYRFGNGKRAQTSAHRKKRK